jgi:beta-lactam-binding protein with PASTA domain
VTGEDDASARADITSAGLHVGTVTLTANCTVPRGTVLSQNPDGGTQVRFGSSVNLNEATRSGSTAQAAPHFCTK